MMPKLDDEKYHASRPRRPETAGAPAPKNIQWGTEDTECLGACHSRAQRHGYIYIYIRIYRSILHIMFHPFATERSKEYTESPYPSPPPSCL